VVVVETAYEVALESIAIELVLIGPRAALETKPRPILLVPAAHDTAAPVFEEA